MARSRYPRRGQRLAPAALRELLQVPVPEGLLEAEQAEGMLLNDLDETVWERFSETACRQLAQEVVRTVGRAARMPISIGDRPLPPIPDGMTLADLDLEIRTVNCLVAVGIHERPQDLRSMTIEKALGLRGFWAKSLVDLLTAIEFATDHPESRKSLLTDAPVPIKHLRASHRYPRPGHRLAPNTLKEVLMDRVPLRMVRGTALRGARLCDLDETAWKHLTPKGIGQVAGLIVLRAGAVSHSRTVLQRRLPKPPKGMRLEDLRLENRTYNCLLREGFGKRPEDLGKLTVARLLSLKAFGSKCLVDLLTSLETLVAREGRLDEELTEAARQLGRLPDARSIQFTDLRLGTLLKRMDSEANSIGELVDGILKRRLDPPDSLHLIEELHEVRRQIQALCELPLEEELMQIFAPAGSDRDKAIVAGYYGWDGQGGHTLEQLGQQHDLSRERIRQICVRAIKRTRGTTVFAPVLDRTLALLNGRFPASLDRLQAELDAAGIANCRLTVDSICRAAEFLGRKPQFAVVEVGRRYMVVHPKHADLPGAIVHAARQVVANYGAAKIADLGGELPERPAGKSAQDLTREALEASNEFTWLDRKRTWFRLDTLPHYGLPNMVEKVLSVAPRIEVSKLRAALARYRRSGRTLPPPKVLLELCRQMPGVRVEGNMVLADPPRDWREVLADVERCMVEVLTEHGPVMGRTAFEEHCIQKGVNRFSFNAIVMCSPVIAQYGRSVYGLLDTKVTRKKIDELRSRKPGARPSRVLRGYGPAGDGLHYLAYRLSKAAISGGVITVPAAMKRKVKGKFTLRTLQGRKVGTLVAKQGCGWGLGPALRGQHAQPGDHLLLLLDPSKREARLRIGDESILRDVAG